MEHKQPFSTAASNACENRDVLPTPIGLQAFVHWTCTEALVQQCSFRTVTADAERQPSPMPTDKTAERESDTGRVEAWLFTGLWPRAPVPLSSHTRITEPRGTKGIHEGSDNK